jgi:hypothetical protein
MGDIYDQFELELTGLDRKYAQHPRRQMMRLFLLALEREEIVSVGYREELIAARVETLRMPEQEREIIRHALLWIWKDEEMHTIYIRGAIFKVGRPTLARGRHICHLDGIADRKGPGDRPPTYSLSLVSGFLSFQRRCRKDSMVVLATIDRINEGPTIHASFVDRRFPAH